MTVLTFCRRSTFTVTVLLFVTFELKVNAAGSCRLFLLPFLQIANHRSQLQSYRSVLHAVCVCCWSDRRMAVAGSVECRRKFIVELKTVPLRAFKVFLGHTAYRLWVTSHVFCSDIHTARPAAAYSSTFGFVIRFVSLRFDSCVTFPGAVSKCGCCILPVEY